MPFSPRQDYQITPEIVRLRDFIDFAEAYITRPPYQRKNVWTDKKKQSLMDSIVRRYYVPKLVFRQVRLSRDRTVSEVIDGQQRITTLQEFFKNEFSLPKSLEDIAPEMVGKTYDDLPVQMKQFVAHLSLSVDMITNIDDPRDPLHQKVATEIFWRLQQGESLNEMEIAHARLSSKVRNFLVKYADDITFDFQKYISVDENPDKHPFFEILDRKNERMQHLALLARMLLVEIKDGPTDVRDKTISDLIDDSQAADGIGNNSYEDQQPAKNVLSVLNLFYDLFKGDPMLKNGGTIKELNREYFILSYFVFLRHIRKFYVVDAEVKKWLRAFFDEFYERWRSVTLEDRDMSYFSESRQQSPNDLRVRDQVMRQMFFEFLSKNNAELISKDTKRAFSEAERIALYRKAKALCVKCVEEGKSPEESTVPWDEYEADHVVPHIKGGTTNLQNAQLLCRTHNRMKGAS